MKKFDLKLALKRLKHAFKDIGSDADKDWKIVLVGAICLLFVIGVVNAKTFYDMYSLKGVEGEAAPASTELIDTKALENVLKAYDERAKDFDVISSSSFSFTDPSR